MVRPVPGRRELACPGRIVGHQCPAGAYSHGPDPRHRPPVQRLPHPSGARCRATSLVGTACGALHRCNAYLHGDDGGGGRRIAGHRRGGVGRLPTPRCCSPSTWGMGSWVLPPFRQPSSASSPVVPRLPLPRPAPNSRRVPFLASLRSAAASIGRSGATPSRWRPAGRSQLPVTSGAGPT